MRYESVIFKGYGNSHPRGHYATNIGSSKVENHLYVQGTLQFNFPWAKSTQLFWKAFTDVCWIMQGNRDRLFFLVFLFYFSGR